MGYAQATILGNLGRNPEVRVINANSKVASFSLAVNEKRAGQEITHWFYVSVWNQLADVVEKCVVKGSKILVSGRLTTRTYIDKDNVSRTVTEVAATVLELVSSSQAQQGTATAPVATASTPPPAAASAPATGSAYRPGEDDALPDDMGDLPF